MLPKVSIIAPVSIPKVSLTLRASTKLSWVCTMTSLIWKVDSKNWSLAYNSMNKDLQVAVMVVTCLFLYSLTPGLIWIDPKRTVPNGCWHHNGNLVI